MAEMTEEDWQALADHLTDPNVELPPPAEVLTGEAAAAHGRAFLLSEYGSEEALDAVLRRAGRTRLGEQPKGASPTVRSRVPEADFVALKRLETETGKSQSELVREAIALLLDQHRRPA